MNVNIGIIFRKSDREKVLLSIPQRRRTWGVETFDEEGPRHFYAQSLAGVEFQIFPVTDFIRNSLPANEKSQELEYAWMVGPALDDYEVWAQSNREFPDLHTFEFGMVALLEKASFWALMFAPEGERLSSYLTADVHEAVMQLRYGASDVSSSEGFLAISS